MASLTILANLFLKKFKSKNFKYVNYPIALNKPKKSYNLIFLNLSLILQPEKSNFSFLSYFN
jgi:hypothetical protein